MLVRIDVCNAESQEELQSLLNEKDRRLQVTHFETHETPTGWPVATISGPNMAVVKLLEEWGYTGEPAGGMVYQDYEVAPPNV